jgi:hypothetical protein
MQPFTFVRACDSPQLGQTVVSVDFALDGLATCSSLGWGGESVAAPRIQASAATGDPRGGNRTR